MDGWFDIQKLMKASADGTDAGELDALALQIVRGLARIVLDKDWDGESMAVGFGDTVKDEETADFGAQLLRYLGGRVDMHASYRFCCWVVRGDEEEEMAVSSADALIEYARGVRIAILLDINLRGLPKPESI